jgi:hypothetical protein
MDRGPFDYRKKIILPQRQFEALTTVFAFISQPPEPARAAPARPSLEEVPAIAGMVLRRSRAKGAAARKAELREEQEQLRR